MYINVLKKMENLFGVSIRYLDISNVEGPCYYDIQTKSIKIASKGRTYEEIVFCILHEVRHAIQFETGIFSVEDLKNALSHEHKDYSHQPWEIDANSWAYEIGTKYKYFNHSFRPSWNPPIRGIKDGLQEVA